MVVVRALEWKFVENIYELAFCSFKCLIGCTVQEPSSNLAIHLVQVSVKYHNTTPYNAHQSYGPKLVKLFMKVQPNLTPSFIPFMSKRTMPSTGSACLKKCLKLIAKFLDKNMRRNNNWMVWFACSRQGQGGGSSRLRLIGNGKWHFWSKQFSGHG